MKKNKYKIGQKVRFEKRYEDGDKSWYVGIIESYYAEFNEYLICTKKNMYYIMPEVAILKVINKK